MACVIYLNNFEIECAVCSQTHIYDPASPSFGVPMYESEILSDADLGEWGGQPVCPRCYFIVRGIQSETPYNAKRLPVSLVRKLLPAKEPTDG